MGNKNKKNDQAQTAATEEQHINPDVPDAPEDNNDNNEAEDNTILRDILVSRDIFQAVSEHLSDEDLRVLSQVSHRANARAQDELYRRFLQSPDVLLKVFMRSMDPQPWLFKFADSPLAKELAAGYKRMADNGEGGPYAYVAWLILTDNVLEADERKLEEVRSAIHREPDSGDKWAAIFDINICLAMKAYHLTGDLESKKVLEQSLGNSNGYMNAQGANLAGLVLRCDGYGLNCKHANLKGARIINARYCNFDDSNLENVTFGPEHDSPGGWTDRNYCKFIYSSFINANLRGADFTKARLDGVTGISFHQAGGKLNPDDLKRILNQVSEAKVFRKETFMYYFKGIIDDPAVGYTNNEKMDLLIIAKDHPFFTAHRKGSEAAKKVKGFFGKAFKTEHVKDIERMIKEIKYEMADKLPGSKGPAS